MEDHSSNDAGWYDADTSTFGDRLMGAREAAGLGQGELAKRIGVKVKTIKAWEDDQAEPRANRAGMLAGLLGVSLTWLLSGQGDGPAEPSETMDEEIEMTLMDLRMIRLEQARLAERIGRLEKRLRAGLASR
jgi:ribosome-binding protein aMBF1 (putative translation factor)